MNAAADRAGRIPKNIAFPSELPITDHLDEIQDHLEKHQVVVVAGDTGSGKTTQLPKLCLRAGFGSRGFIGHTQPRRIAARRVAARVAEELSLGLGDEIGYAMRFTDRCPPGALVKLMTDGLMLAETRSDRLLSKYEVIIIDEAHERSLNIDFLLGYLKQILARRKDLKLIVTSATIDLDTYARHFDDAPIVEVSGRSYPIELTYHEPVANADLVQLIIECLGDIQKNPVVSSRARDVLVFLSGEREIFDTARELRRRLMDARQLHYEVLPLYARLTATEQNRVFKTTSQRRIVLATNVAETSLTVPGIGYVIDPGWARVSRYSYRSKLQRLPIEPISQASATQRMGRCGRIAPGRCYRLYSETDFLSRPEYSEPEIKRTNLASVVLQMRAFGLGDIRHFPFVEAPDSGAVGDAVRLLEELQALASGSLTSIGRSMARIPLDPRLARMVVEGAKRDVLREILIIVSALSIQDPRERPLEKQSQADQQHAEFADQRSDFLAFVRIWDWYQNQRQACSSSALGRLLKKRFLSSARMREWRNLHRQLLIVCQQMNFRVNEKAGDYAGIHQAILSGSLSLIGLKQGKGEYLGPRQLKFRLFPGSGLRKKTPKWVVCAEIAETRRIYARTVAEVKPGWIEAQSKHLQKKTYAEPHWNPRRGEVTAGERVRLYGLSLVENRQVSYKTQDPDLCRDLMIREGLLTGAFQTRGEFLTTNLSLFSQVVAEEEKMRLRGLVAEAETLAGFYAERIPREVCDQRGFERWRTQAEEKQPRLLFMSKSRVMLGKPADELDFPSSIDIDGVRFRIKYKFAPGQPDDGVSVRVPAGQLHHLSGDALDWLVPGFLSSKCEALLKSLKKSERRLLAPVPEKVAELTPILARGDKFRVGRLSHILGELVEGLYAVHIPTTSWNMERLAPHLRMNIQVLDPNGKQICQGRDLRVLKKTLQPASEDREDRAVRHPLEQEGLEEFPSDKLPKQLILKNNTLVYPAISDAGESVAVTFAGTVRQQSRINRSGYSRLAMLYQRQSVRFFRSEIKKERQLGLYYSVLGTAQQLEQQLLHTAFWYCFFEDRNLPTTEPEFTQRLAENKSNLTQIFCDLVTHTREILSARFDLQKTLQESLSPAFSSAKEDITCQLQRLLPSTFLDTTPSRYLSDIPRYIRAAEYRLKHLQGKVEKDAAMINEVASFDLLMEQVRSELGDTPEVLAFKFAIEEYRIALFAQALGARGKVSKKRLRKMVEPLAQAAEIEIF